jgi:hypothetical protein
MKLGFLVWLMYPGEHNGSMIVYSLFLEPYLKVLAPPRHGTAPLCRLQYTWNTPVACILLPDWLHVHSLEHTGV